MPGEWAHAAGGRFCGARRAEALSGGAERMLVGGGAFVEALRAGRLRVPRMWCRRGVVVPVLAEFFVS